MHQSDSILDEVRAAREALSREYNYDVRKLAEAMREKDRLDPRPTLKLPIQRLVQGSTRNEYASGE